MADGRSCSLPMNRRSTLLSPSLSSALGRWLGCPTCPPLPLWRRRKGGRGGTRFMAPTHVHFLEVRPSHRAQSTKGRQRPHCFQHRTTPTLSGSWSVSRSVRNKGLPMNRSDGFRGIHREPWQYVESLPVELGSPSNNWSTAECSSCQRNDPPLVPVVASPGRILSRFPHPVVVWPG